MTMRSGWCIDGNHRSCRVAPCPCFEPTCPCYISGAEVVVVDLEDVRQLGINQAVTPVAGFDRMEQAEEFLMSLDQDDVANGRYSIDAKTEDLFA